jgi:medium-chain acyl-[acyl-carrier-protein] hydrolase
LLPLVNRLAQALDPYLAVPFVLFGHSMGGLVSFELARVLRKQHRPTPQALFVSGHRAAHLPDRRPPVHLLPEPEFLAEMHRLQGTPEEVFRNRELMELFMPILRADFSLCETYAYTAETPLDCPITAFGGLEDSEVSHEEMAAWRAHTCARFTLHMFPGNHFFVQTALARLLEIVSQELTLILRQLEPQAR